MEEVLAKYFSGNLAKTEKEKVDVWRGESIENASDFFNSKQAWITSAELTVDMNTALKSVVNKIDNTADINATHHVDNKFFIPPMLLKYAATILVILGLGLVLYQSNSLFGLYNSIEIVSGDVIKEVVLPDGSVITLYKNSTLEYAKDFNETSRKVALSGKAFFDVKRDENIPFYVITNSSEIKVLGTSFMVNSLSSGLETEVVVVSGKVSVTNKVKENINEPRVLDLLPGESVLVSKERSFNKVTNAKSNFLAWKTGLISFEKDSLKSVLIVLNDIYGINVSLSENNMNNCLLSAKFNNQTVSSILEIIGATFGFELKKIDKQNFTFTGSGCIDAN